jgi:hypothetical protein
MEMSGMRKLIDSSFERSYIAHYPRLSPSLSYHLQRVIEIPDTGAASVDRQIRETLSVLKRSLELIGPMIDGK